MEVRTIIWNNITPLQEVRDLLEPLITSVKIEISKENKDYLETIAQEKKTISGNPIQDDDEVERGFLNCMRSTNFYPNTNMGEIQYPHNVYSIYTPVNAELEVDDEFVRTFPILKKHKEDINTEAKAEFYAMISKEMNLAKQKQKAKIVWKNLVKKWIWEVDILQSITYYHLLLKIGYSVIPLLKKQYPHVQASVFEQHLQRTIKQFEQSNTLRKDTQFSIDARQQINQISIVKTTKQLFCGSCFVYDCPKHKLQDHIVEEHNQYIHPKNKPNLNNKIQTATELLKHYYRYCTSNMQQQPINSQFCSEKCYFMLDKQKFQQQKYQINSLLSPSIRALINLGIQMVAYSPCHISLIAKSKMTCSLVFWYIIKVIDIQSAIQRNFMDSSQYLMSIKVVDVNEEKKKKNKKEKGNKKKENTVPEYNSSVVTPLCFHHFLHKETGQAEATCTDCTCAKRKFCLPSCLCDPKCTLRIKGCNCCKNTQKSKNAKSCDKSCPCFQANRQCDPLVCHGCFPQNDTNKNKYGQIVHCTNNQYQLQNYPRLKLGLSTLPGGGLGLFSGQFIRRDSIILTYTGQTIDNSLQDTRQKVANDLYFYNFQFNQGSIDAKFFGNKARFINHDNGQLQNCYSKIRFAKTDNFLAIYAQRDITKDEQLFFDYDGNGVLFQSFKVKYPFIKARIKPRKQA